MDKLLHFLITNLVDHPEAVAIAVTHDATGTVILTAAVAPEDMGKVIGRSGRVITAIREIIKVKAVKTNQRAKVVLAEPTQTDSLSRSQPEAESADKP